MEYCNPKMGINCKIGLGFKSVNMYSNKYAGANAKILAVIDLDALRKLYGHTSKLMTTKSCNRCKRSLS